MTIGTNLDKLNQFYGDEALNVEFFSKIVENRSKILDDGSYVFDKIDCVRISSPANDKFVYEGLAVPSYRMRFANQWKAYDDSRRLLIEVSQHNGVPIEDWARLERDQVKALKQMGFNTVEQIAGISDANLSQISNLFAESSIVVRERARKFLIQNKKEDNNDSVKQSKKLS